MVTSVPVSAAATVMPHWHVTVCAAATVTTVAIATDRCISIIWAVVTGVTVSTVVRTTVTRVTVCAATTVMANWHVTVCAAATITTVATRISVSSVVWAMITGVTVCAAA